MLLPPASAADVTFDNGGGDNNWNNALNWDNAGANGLPTAADVAHINLGVAGSPNSGARISGALTEATVAGVRIGDGGTGVVSQTAGTINVTGETVIGAGGGNVGEFYISGGTYQQPDQDGDQWNYIGQAGGSGTFVQTGGLVQLSDRTQVGFDSTGLLDVAGGTFKVNSDLIIADGTGGNGTVKVHNPGTVLQTSVGVVVGQSDAGVAGSALMEVYDGATVNVGGWLNVGNQMAGASTLNIKGAGSKMTATELRIKANGDFAGAAEVNVRDGGNLTINDHAYVGVTTNGPGSLNVDNATVKVGGNLWLGLDAGSTGTINLTNNAVMTSSRAGTTPAIGWGGTGELNISGDSSFTSAGDWMQVGVVSGSHGTINLNSGTFRVTSGDGTPNLGWIMIGQGPGSTGTFKMDGGLADFQNDLRVGNAGGNGTFIQNGGEVHVGAGTGVNNSYVGADVGSVGYMEINGGTFTMHDPNFFIGYVRNTSGGFGQGTFKQTGGTTTFNNFVVSGGWVDGMARGTAEITGGTFNTTAVLEIGQGFEGFGDMSQSGGTVNVGTDFITGQEFFGSAANNVTTYKLSGAGSTFNVNGATRIAEGVNSTSTFDMDGGTANFTGRLNVGYNGAGTFNQTGGLVTVGAAGMGIGNGNVSVGVYNINNGASLSSAGPIRVGANQGNGTLNIDGAATTINALSSLAVGGETAGPANVGVVNQNNGTVTVGGQLIAAARANSNGTYNLNGGVLNVADGEIGSDNNLDGGGPGGTGRLIVGPAGTMNIAGRVEVGGGGSAANGLVRMNGTANGNFEVNTRGVLDGIGTINGILEAGDGGRLKPGNGIGTLTTSTLTMLGGSNLDIELGAPASGDRINVTSPTAGSVNLSDLPFLVNVSNAGGMAPGTYTIIDYNDAGSVADHPVLGPGSLGNMIVLGSDPGVGYKVADVPTVGVSAIQLSVITGTQWKGDAGGNILWSTAANWDAGVPNAIDAFAIFGGNAVGAGSSVTVDGALKTVGRMYLNNTGPANVNYTISGAPIAFDVAAGTAVLQSFGGNHTINSNVIMADNNLAISAVPGSSISFNGTITRAAPALPLQLLAFTGGGEFKIGNTVTVESLAATTVPSAIAVNDGTLTHSSPAAVVTTDVLYLAVNNAATYNLNAGQLRVGDLDDSGFLSTLNINGGTFVPTPGSGVTYDVDVLNIGNGASGAHTAADPSHTYDVNFNMNVGLNGGTGTFDISAGTLRVNDDYVNQGSGHLYVGRSGGNGTLAVSGTGVVESRRDFVVGADAGSIGVVNQNASLVRAGASAASGRLYLGVDGGTGTYNLSGTGTLLVDSRIYVGRNGGVGVLNQGPGTTITLGGVDTNSAYFVGSNDGTGTVNQTGGTASAVRVNIADNTSATGTYNLSGGSLTTSREMLLANTASAQGTMNQSGGQVNVGGWLQLGGRVAAQPATVGAYNLTGNGVLNAGTDSAQAATTGDFLGFGNDVLIGNSGTGTFTIDDAAVANLNAAGTGTTYVGNDNGSIGELNVKGGTMNVGANMIVGDNAGAKGSVFVDSPDAIEGTLNVTGNMIVANEASTIGTVDQTDGAVHVGNRLTIANGGTGSYRVGSGGSGGTLSAASIVAGELQNSNGTLSVEGTASVTVAGNTTIGVLGTGSYNQTGGSFSTGGLIVGRDFGGVGTATLNGAGSTLTVGADLVVGSSGDGTMTQINGAATVGGSLIVGAGAGSSGDYTMVGGTLAVAGNGNLGAAGTGFMTQSGGNVRIGNLAAGTGDLNIGAGGLYTLSGSSNPLDPLASRLTVGNNLNATGVLPSDRFVMTGGILTVGGTLDFTQDGGLLNVTGTLPGNNTEILVEYRLNAGTATINDGNTLLVSGNLLNGAGAGIINVGTTGSGTLTVTGTADVDTLNLRNGTVSTAGLTVTNATAIPTNVASTVNGPVTMASGGTINMAAGSLTLNGRLGTSNGTIGGAGTLNATGGFSIAAGGLTLKNGAGTTTIAGLQSHGAGAVLTTTAGTTNLNSDAGGNLTVNANSPVATNFGSTTHLQGLTVGSGATATITPGGGKVLVTNNLGTIAGKLDVTDNDMVVHATPGTEAAVLSSVTGYLTTGSNGAAWNGNGINSSAAANDASFLTAVGVMLNNDGLGGPFRTNFSGEPVDQFSILVKYTYYGDADLSGSVDGTDYALTDNGFNAQLTGWVNGDFDYSGVVDGTDYALIDNAFNSQGGPLGAGVAAVPEPSTVGLFAVSGLSLLALRRRRKV